MFLLFGLLMLASPVGLVVGLINPRRALPPQVPEQYRNRLTVLRAYPSLFFVSLLGAAMTAPPQEQITPSTVSSVPTSSAPAPVATPSSQVVESAPPAPKPVADWRSRLPAESAELRAKYESDPWLQGWLSTQKTWIGYADADDLVKRGFFVNASWKSNGAGIAPEGTQYGSCSALGFDGEFACGVGAFDSPTWGVQSDEAIEHFKKFMN